MERQGKEIESLRKSLAQAEARTDLTIALEPLLHAITLHESNAERRTTAMIGVMEQIGNSIGTES